MLPSHFVYPIKETTTAGYLLSSFFLLPKIGDITSFLVIRSPSSKIKSWQSSGSHYIFPFFVAFCPFPSIIFYRQGTVWIWFNIFFVININWQKKETVSSLLNDNLEIVSMGGGLWMKWNSIFYSALIILSMLHKWLVSSGRRRESSGNASLPVMSPKASSLIDGQRDKIFTPKTTGRYREIRRKNKNIHHPEET